MTLLKVRQVALLRRSPANLASLLKPRLHIPDQIPFRLVAKVQARHTEQAELACGTFSHSAASRGVRTPLKSSRARPPASTPDTSSPCHPPVADRPAPPG